MSEAILNPTITSDASNGLNADALRAQEWAGEPFLHPGEEPAEVLAPGTARRAALDDALAEMEGGLRSPSPRWKVRFGLLLGLERVLSSKPPATASGTELRKHQIDALAGMLTELIAANQRQAEDLNGNGAVEAELDDGRRRGRGRARVGRRGGRDRRGDGVHGRGPGRRPPLPVPAPDRVRQDHRRRRLRRGGAHARDPDPDPPPPARHPVPARPDDRGVRRPFRRRDRARAGGAAREPDHDPDLRLVRAARRLDLARRVPARDLRRGAHGSRREDERRDPQLLGAALHRHDRDGAADREAGLGRLPRLGRRPPAHRRSTPRTDRAAALPARSARRGDQRGADRRRRLRGARARRGARPPGAQPGGSEPLSRALRLDAGHRLRRRRRPRLQPRAGVSRRRAEGRGGLRPHAAGQARRDAGRIRARRDQRPDQRDAARRGLELAARDHLHAPRPDRVEARLPAADRPHHAHAPPQGGRASSSTSRRSARLTTSASSRCTRCSTPTSTARERASRLLRAVASSAAPVAASRRRRGSSRSPPTSRAGSP